jgi:hypothetical protein
MPLAIPESCASNEDHKWAPRRSTNRRHDLHFSVEAACVDLIFEGPALHPWRYQAGQNVQREQITAQAEEGEDVGMIQLAPYQCLPT